jgi:hypothetical protein
VVVDGDRVYAVADVINTKYSSINEDCEVEDDQDNAEA